MISLADALFGAAIGGGLLWGISEAYFRVRGREGMGLGDVKMMLMAGAFLGTKRTLLTIFAGSLAGKRSGRRVHFGAAKRFRLRAALRHVSGLGRDAGGLLRHAGRELVSVVADGEMIAMQVKARSPITADLPPAART